MSGQPAFAPEPPPIDEKLAALDDVPLLMQSLPDGPADNIALDALQSLAYDGTPDGGSSLCDRTYSRFRRVQQRSRRTSRSKETSTLKGNATGRRWDSTRRASTPSRQMWCCKRHCSATVQPVIWSWVRFLFCSFQWLWLEVDAVRSHRKLWVRYSGLRKSLGEQFPLLESFVPLRPGAGCARSAGGGGRALRSMSVI